MTRFFILALCCLLPGCAILTTDCGQERDALRAADSAIAQATRSQKRVFSAQLASRGHATYQCVSGKSGQVQCRRAPTAGAGTDIEALYRKRDAAAARVAQICDARG